MSNHFGSAILFRAVLNMTPLTQYCITELHILHTVFFQGKGNWHWGWRLGVKELSGWRKGRRTQKWNFEQARLQMEGEGESRSVVFHIGGQLFGLSVLPVMKLKLNALSVSAPLKELPWQPQYPQTLLKAFWVPAERKDHVKQMLIPSPSSAESVQTWELYFSVWRLLLS